MTKQAGVGDGGFSTSALWFDYDKDGKLDLFVANYVQWTPTPICTVRSTARTSPTARRSRTRARVRALPEPRQRHVEGRHAQGRRLRHSSKGWRGDARLRRRRLDGSVRRERHRAEPALRNNGNGTFEDVAVRRASPSASRAWRVPDGRRRRRLRRLRPAQRLIGNFSNEMMALYHNEGNGLFIDDAPRSTIGQASLLTPHVRLLLLRLRPRRAGRYLRRQRPCRRHRAPCSAVTYAQPPHLFRNSSGEQFEDVRQAGRRSAAGRRAARLRRYDIDGDLDALMNVNNGPARLLRNDGGQPRQCRSGSARIGTASNRDGIGARVEVTVAGGR